MADTCDKTQNLDELLIPLQTILCTSKTSMQAFLRNIRSEAFRFVEAAEFSEVRPYGRRLVLQTPALEVLVMGFHPRREGPPHDHGGSDGLVLVCSGTAEHRIYRREGGGLKLVERRLERARNILDAPIDCVHAMGNPGPEPLVTLHLYWPPIKHMTVFDIEGHKIYEVSGAAGAWLPIAPETLISCTKLE